MTCAEVYELFFEPGEVTEIRAYGLKKANKAWEGWAFDIVYGYFDNAKAFGQAAMALDRAKAAGIYFTLNPVIPDFLARAPNRLKASGTKPIQTNDDDILCLRWLPIDLDPLMERPSGAWIKRRGVASSETELKMAMRYQDLIADWMEKTLHWPRGIRAMSGNGTHLLYRLPDLPDPQVSKTKVKTCLAAIRHQFKTAEKFVDIDQKVFNPARIWKLYGTTARKGDHTELRPHRKSYINEDINGHERK